MGPPQRASSGTRYGELSCGVAQLRSRDGLACTRPFPLFWRSFRFGFGHSHLQRSFRRCRLFRLPLEKPAFE